MTLASLLLARTETVMAASPTYTEQRLSTTNGDPEIGSDLATDGQVLIVAGASDVHVFARTVDGWVNVQTITGIAGALSLDGNTLAVGSSDDDLAGEAAGAVRLYQRADSDPHLPWSHVATLRPSVSHAGARFGASVALSGNRLVVGAMYGFPILGPQPAPTPSALDRRGVVYVFDRTAAGWVETKKISAPGGTDHLFGAAVDVDGDALIVAASRTLVLGRPLGSAYIFERNVGGNNAWGAVATFTPPEGQTEELFGCDVAISSGTAVIGNGLLHDSSRPSIFVLGRNGASWAVVDSLSTSVEEGEVITGCSLALDRGSLLASGRLWLEPEQIRLATVAHLYTNDSGHWTRVHRFGPLAGTEVGSGNPKVALAEDLAVVGAYLRGVVSAFEPTCGNNRLDGGEECDDGTPGVLDRCRMATVSCIFDDLLGQNSSCNAKSCRVARPARARIAEAGASGPLTPSWVASMGAGDHRFLFELESVGSDDSGQPWHLPRISHLEVRSLETNKLALRTRLIRGFKPTVAAGTFTLQRPGRYTLALDGLDVPTSPEVQRYLARLTPTDGSDGRSWNGFLVAEKRAKEIPLKVTVDLGGVAETLTVAALSRRLAPVLEFRRSAFCSQDNPCEPFDAPYDAATVLAIADVSGPVAEFVDDAKSALDLSALSEGKIGRPEDSTIYFNAAHRTVSTRRELALNYWFHYPRSNWCDYGGVNTHEGDWEGVTAFLKTNDAGVYEPDRIAFGQHAKISFVEDGGETVPWELVDLDPQGRPTVFVGLGGHASYPDSAVDTYGAYDEDHRGGKRVVADKVIELPLATVKGVPNWLLYQGHWGAAELDTDCPFFGTAIAPRGPLYIESGFAPGQRWLDPWSWSAGFDEYYRPGNVGAANCRQVGTVFQCASESNEANAERARPATSECKARLSGTAHISGVDDALAFDFRFSVGSESDTLLVRRGASLLGEFRGSDHIQDELHTSGPIVLGGQPGTDITWELCLVGAPGSGRLDVAGLRTLRASAPDLTVSALQAPSLLGAGPRVRVSLGNGGTAGVSSNSEIEVQLIGSTDATLDESDTTIATDVVAVRLAPQARFEFEIEASETGPLGMDYVIVRAVGDDALGIDGANDQVTLSLKDGSLCPAAPSASCLSASKARLSILDEIEREKDRLLVDWTEGNAPPEFGNPSSDSLGVCIYDHTSKLVFAASPLLGECDGGSACWKGGAAGYSYSNPSGSPSGLRKIKLKSARPPRGKARVTISGGGSDLEVPSADGDRFFGGSGPVTVQINHLDGSLERQCWNAVLRDVKKNTNRKADFRCGGPKGAPCEAPHS